MKCHLRAEMWVQLLAQPASKGHDSTGGSIQTCPIKSTCGSFDRSCLLLSLRCHSLSLQSFERLSSGVQIVPEAL